MDEEIIKAIEEAVTGEELFGAIVRAFISAGAPEGFEDSVVNTVIISQDDYEELETPTPDNDIYFIEDADFVS